MKHALFCQNKAPEQTFSQRFQSNTVSQTGNMSFISIENTSYAGHERYPFTTESTYVCRKGGGPSLVECRNLTKGFKSSTRCFCFCVRAAQKCTHFARELCFYLLFCFSSTPASSGAPKKPDFICSWYFFVEAKKVQIFCAAPNKSFTV